MESGSGNPLGAAMEIGSGNPLGAVPSGIAQHGDQMIGIHHRGAGAKIGGHHLGAVTNGINHGARMGNRGAMIFGSLHGTNGDISHGMNGNPNGVNRSGEEVSVGVIISGRVISLGKA